MKATKLIELLQEGIKQFGDMNVEASLENNETDYLVSEIKNVTTKAYCDGNVFLLRDWKQ